MLSRASVRMHVDGFICFVDFARMTGVNRIKSVRIQRRVVAVSCVPCQAAVYGRK